MKKNYIAPSIEVIEIQTESLLQATSVGLESEFVGEGTLLAPQPPFGAWDGDSEW